MILPRVNFSSFFLQGLVHECCEKVEQLKRSKCSSGKKWHLFSFQTNLENLTILFIQVIGICTQDEPLCLLSEFSEYGDLYQFLRNNSHSSSNNNNISNTSSNSSKCHYSNASDLALLHAASPNTSVTSSSSNSSANIRFVLSGHKNGLH